MAEMRICLDVADVDRAAAFYVRALGLRAGRRFDAEWLELLGGPCPIDLLGKKAGSEAVPGTDLSRNYERHWTPLHLDFVVADIRAAVRTAQEAGARIEVDVEKKPYGYLALLSDPFGHGFCFLEMIGKGYDEIAKS